MWPAVVALAVALTTRLVRADGSGWPAWRRTQVAQTRRAASTRALRVAWELGQRGTVARCLEQLAASSVGESERWVGVGAAAGAIQAPAGGVRWPDEVGRFERWREATREAIGAGAYAAEEQRGAVLSLNEAVELALLGAPHSWAGG